MIKLSEYEETLPYPLHFPGNIYSVRGYPMAIADRYIVDLYGMDTPNTSPAIDVLIDRYIENHLKSGKILGEPEYIADSTNFKYLIMYDASNEPIGVQVSYYQYFVIRYKGCVFMRTDTIQPIAVVHKESYVGFIAPVVAKEIYDIHQKTS